MLQWFSNLMRLWPDTLEYIMYQHQHLYCIYPTYNINRIGRWGEWAHIVHCVRTHTNTNTLRTKTHSSCGCVTQRHKLRKGTMRTKFSPVIKWNGHRIHLFNQNGTAAKITGNRFEAHLEAFVIIAFDDMRIESRPIHIRSYCYTKAFGQ